MQKPILSLNIETDYEEIELTTNFIETYYIMNFRGKSTQASIEKINTRIFFIFEEQKDFRNHKPFIIPSKKTISFEILCLLIHNKLFPYIFQVFYSEEKLNKTAMFFFVRLAFIIYIVE